MIELTTLLVRPGAFFEERAEDVDPKGPLATVAAVSLVGVLGAVGTLTVQALRLPGEALAFLAIGAVFALGLRAAMPVLAWLFYAVAFLVVTLLFEGEGEPRDLILLAGWGMAPRVLGVLALSGAALGANLLVHPPAGVETTQAYSQQVTQHPLNVLGSVLQLLTFLWSGYIWVAAVAAAREVTRTQAAVAVAVPLALELLVSLGLVALALAGTTMG